MPDQVFFEIRNLSNHRVTFKSFQEQSGKFEKSPNSIIPATGITNQTICLTMQPSYGKAVVMGLAFAIPLLFRAEKGAGSISLTVETKSYTYTITLGAKNIYGYGNKAGVEIRGGELKLGMDRTTLHGVDASGTLDVDTLCAHTNRGGNDEWHTFYEDTHSNSPEEGFTVKTSFDNGSMFRFEIHPLSKEGRVFRG